MPIEHQHQPGSAGPAVTVVLSTHNGASTLPRMFDALALLDAPVGGWKLLVVDNGSTDDTPAILARNTARLPLTCMTERGRGKNRALNAALPFFAGELIVLTDDDVVPNRDWLVQLQRAA